MAETRAMNRILLLGGSGFVGAALTHKLVEQGAHVLIPSRQPERCRILAALPGVEVVEADIHDPAALAALISGCDAVINLVGILHGASMQSPYCADFARAHVELPKKVVAACRAAGVRRLVHMSALKADPAGPSEYLASKGDGERIVHEAAPELDVTIFRPSVIFGSGDRFISLFVRIHRLAPVFPLGSGHARLQPVWVGDVADVFAACLDDAATFGKTYDLCGPRAYTLRELVEFAAQLAGRRAPVIPLGDGLARLQASLLWLAPEPLLSPDNLNSLKVDNVCGDGCNCFPGWKPAALEEVAPTHIQTDPSLLDRLRGLLRR